MKWLLNLLGSQAGPWIILGFLGVWTGSLAGMYLKGAGDGKAHCEARYERQQAQQMRDTLQLVLDNQESLIEGQRLEKIENQKFAETLENKIHNKETIVKEKLREIPIEVASDCTIDYNAVRVHNIIADPTADN